MIFRLSILLLFAACGELSFSPYEVQVTKSVVNEKNLQKIFNSSKYSQKSDSFSIAIISDTHDYYDGLEKQVNYINNNSQSFDFVIVTGDLSNVGLVEEFEQTKKRLDKLNLPYITTSGNHDLLINGRQIYKAMFGNDTYSFEYKNTKFILYNNNNWESPSNVPDFNWVEHELASNSKSNLILLSHVAPNDTDRFTGSQISHIQELVDRYSVHYYINGHNHNPGTGNFGNATHLTVGASSKSTVLELTLSGSGVSHVFKSL